MVHYVGGALIFLATLSSFIFIVESREPIGDAFILGGSDERNGNTDNPKAGKRWAVLIAGSNGYENYRHQADVCHAYQLLSKGGLKDENIVVFMYDDIAFNKKNPRPGVIINQPYGPDVYHGVPKDYTGNDVNVGNFFAVILGNKTALTGGSGKVVDSGPNDHIFIYYSDHGGSGMLGMPSGDFLYAKDLIEVLKKKHNAKSYERMVFYVEACESGSIFEGLLPKNLNIYATTASNAEESSWGTYCPGPAQYYSYPPEYDTCLGDLYSVSWMEDSDKYDLRRETLEQQYEVVKKRTAYDDLEASSHVMKYGNMGMSKDFLFSYIGTNPANDNYTSTKNNSLPSSISRAVSQRDADLLHFLHKFHKAPKGSHEKLEAQKQLADEISLRMHVDQSMKRIVKLLFGSEKGRVVLKTIRPSGKPLVDDWDCLKMLVSTYEEHCGSLSNYGMKYMGAIANLCNAGVNAEKMAVVSAQACVKILPSSRSSKHHDLINE